MRNKILISAWYKFNKFIGSVSPYSAYKEVAFVPPMDLHALPQVKCSQPASEQVQNTQVPFSHLFRGGGKQCRQTPIRHEIWIRGQQGSRAKKPNDCMLQKRVKIGVGSQLFQAKG